MRETATTNVLSLDAGGIKGIYTALMAARIEEIFKINFNLNFDYYVGTSIGAVIAAALAAGVKSEDILNKFLSFKNEIHKGHIHLTGKLFDWLDYLFGDKKLGCIHPKLFIPLFNLTLRQHSYISNYSAFDDFKISDVLKAACSDLRIMKPYEFDKNKSLFADAGFFAYDPTIFFLRYHQGLLNAQTHIISIGSGLLSNALEDLNKSDIFDTLYDSFLQEQFMTTKFFFNKTKELYYLRITEFPLNTFNRFSIEDIINMAENRVSILSHKDLAKFQKYA